MENQSHDFEDNGLGASSEKTDLAFIEDVRSKELELFGIAKNHIASVLDKSKSEYRDEPILNLVAAEGASGKSYTVRIEMYFPREVSLYWWVTFNVPASSSTIELLGFKYQPVELGRYVE